jgi:hypothetical protein
MKPLKRSAEMPPGRPTRRWKAECARLARERELEARSPHIAVRGFPILGPPVPKGLNLNKGWGGARPGSGRKKSGESKKTIMLRIDRGLEAKLAALPGRARDEYLTQAVDLMVTVSPPEKFRSGKNECVPPQNDTPAAQSHT